MNYKKTLNLPKTKFPMKANLTNIEVKQLELWEKINLYKLIINKTKFDKSFVLHDGPPYANGHIHMGTALNKILKDIVIRSKQMMGFNAEYVPGWDCHGLPIEHNVDKKIGSNKKQMSITEFRKLCRQYAHNFVDIHKSEFKRLGIMGEWDNPYLTMDYRYEAIIARECCSLLKNGSLFKNTKPIHWCCNCNTALAEAEIEYNDEVSNSIYVKFPIKNIELIFPKLKNKETSLVIWTTTPWTLPANLAVALNPKISYAAININKETLILAKELVSDCMFKFNITNYDLAFEFNASKLENKECLHPLYDKNSLIIMGDHVTIESGTGCVHTAPGHGREDYEIGLKYGLEPYCPVNEKGIFKNDIELFKGQFVLDANDSIIKKLGEKGNLLCKQKISHSYPHCWRCNKPIIFRATPQWFISMEETNLRQRALDSINQVKWIPNWGYDRIHKMLENRPDWCISRQRTWGVPITIFSCEKCTEPYINDDTTNHIFSLFNKYGADIWFEKGTKDLMPPNCICKKCGNKTFTKEKDILDVWFDSGISHIAVLEDRLNLNRPADLYLEGSDQHRGWFQSSLLTSINNKNSAPYKSVLTHGFVVDAEGKKMSKSVGNVISPKTIINKYGAEILRLWVAASDYKDDIKISDNILKQLSDAYRRIRNTSRFLLGNLYDFNHVKNSINVNDLIDIDRYALHKLQCVLNDMIKAYKTYSFHILYHKLYEYCISDLSSFYLDIVKDRLYTSAPNSFERRSVQTVLYKILNKISRIMAPILIFTSEEIWNNMPFSEKEEKSIHLLKLPKVDEKLIDWDLHKKWEIILDLRSEVTIALEEARKNKLIGHSLNSSITLSFSEKNTVFQVISKYKSDLSTIFIVSEVNILEKEISKDFTKTKMKGISIKVEASNATKCDRCWIHSKSVGKSLTHPKLCSRCRNVVASLSEN